MKKIYAVLCFLILRISIIYMADSVDDQFNEYQSTVMVAILVRNKAHVLPYFLYYFENLDYPKDKIHLWIRCDHNADNSVLLFEKWIETNKNLYVEVNFLDDPLEIEYNDAFNINDWPNSRFQNILNLRQQALLEARNKLIDYLLFIDLDNFIVNNQTLKILIKSDKAIIAPMLNTSSSESYTNFWGAMDKQGYYKRSSDYLSILNREKIGTFKVPVIHSTFLIHIGNPLLKGLSFVPPTEYKGPYDDIVIFAFSAHHNGINMHVINTHFFGYMLIPVGGQLGDEISQFVHTLLENIVDDTPLKQVEYLKAPHIKTSSLGFDKIYTVNLKRRPDRREKMVDCYRELGIESLFVDAVDGKILSDDALKNLGISMLPNFADPYHASFNIKRPMTFGEIGCFLSHFYIWRDIVANGYDKVIIFEDDIRFRIYFHEKLQYLMADIKKFNITWDLIYLGRKRLKADEFHIEHVERLVWPEYSYWTLGYMLSLEGAKKLLNADPLTKMVPVDEFLPIMYNKHPNQDWMVHFEPRNLIAFSSYPLLVEPTKYTGEPGYITDTEDSPVLQMNTINKYENTHGQSENYGSVNSDISRLSSGHFGYDDRNINNAKNCGNMDKYGNDYCSIDYTEGARNPEPYRKKDMVNTQG